MRTMSSSLDGGTHLTTWPFLLAAMSSRCSPSPRAYVGTAVTNITGENGVASLSSTFSSEAATAFSAL